MAERSGHQSRSPIGKRLDRYVVLEELGRGGMGIVFRAEDPDLGRQVALKVLPSELVEDQDRIARLKREARTLASLTHPCIIALYDVAEIDGQLVLVMELAHGRTLAELIPPGGFEPETLFRLAIPFVDGVAAAHGRGIVHRDLKPANVIVTPEGRVKILDFGLAKLREDLSETGAGGMATDALTAPGDVAGTAAYMAPEQIRGSPADERSDIFSVGILLYQMVAGRHPFHSGTGRWGEVVSSILRDDPLPLEHARSGLHRDLERILRTCLEKDPERRFQSAKDLRNELERLEKEIAGPPSQPPRARRRRRAVAALAAGLLLVGPAAGWWLYRELSRPPPPTVAPVHLAMTEFRGLAGDPAPAYYREGLVSVLSERLSALEGVWIVPPEGDPLPDFVVQADLSRRGPDLTLLLEVAERSPRRALGSEVLRGRMEAPYELVDRAGAALAGILREEAGIPARYRARQAPTRDREAFEAYLRALALAEGDETGDPGPALTLTESALEADPGFAPAWVLAGELRLAGWRLDRRPEPLAEAEAACRRAVELEAESAAGHLCAAQVLSAQERLLEAEEEYVRTIQLDPTLIAAYDGLNGVFHDLGNPDRGERTWKRLIDARPGFWAGPWALGFFYYSSERYEDAIEQYRRALELAPENAGLYRSMGAAQHVLGRYEEAILAYERSLQVRPNFRALTNLGTIHLLLRRFPEAVASYEQAVEFPEANFAAYGSLALAYFWSPGRDRNEATEAFRKSAALCRNEVEWAPSNAAAWIWLALDLAMLDEHDSSLEALSEALRLNPQSPHYFFFAARIYHRLGEIDEALRWLERAVAGGYPRAEIRLSVEFDDLRNEPRFRELLEGV